MTKFLQNIDLKGSLTLQMDQHVIKIECEGQLIKLIFTSFNSIYHAVHVYRLLNKNFSELNKGKLHNIGFRYYLGTNLIGESDSNLPFSWIGYFLGKEKTKFYPRQLLNYFFS